MRSPKLRRRTRRLQARVRNIFEVWYPESAATALARTGLRLWNGDRSDRLIADNVKGCVVVLVHGLDSQGVIWRSLIPILQKAGYTVVEFHYPNDQAIDQSGELLAHHLAELKTMGVQRVRIVAHSMGGLVARQMLTEPGLYDGRGRGHAPWPDVVRLIMVATPNHGSKLAPLSVGSEVSEHFIRHFSGDGVLFGTVFDGVGEACADLMPDSVFLARLNARPHPRDVATTIVAGAASPVTAERIEVFNRRWRGALPGGLRGSTDAVIDALSTVSEGMGDGAVSVESTRLAGVEDHVIVKANHISLLKRNFGRKSVPTAIPVILDRLDRDGDAPVDARRQRTD